MPSALFAEWRGMLLVESNLNGRRIEVWRKRELLARGWFSNIEEALAVVEGAIKESPDAVVC
jgi:hypothetical protein